MSVNFSFVVRCEFSENAGLSELDRGSHVLSQAGPCPTLRDLRGQGPLRKKKTGSRTRGRAFRVRPPVRE